MRAFSLIELLIVITIIGALSALAIPAYKQYQIKAAVANNIPIIEQVAADVMSVYAETNSFPTSITFNGVSIPVGAWTSVNGATVATVHASVSPDGYGFVLAFSLTGNPITTIPNYAYSNGALPNPAAYSVINIGIRDFGQGRAGATRSVCGQWAFANQDIPLDYLPPGCQCTSVNSFATDGSGGC